jgi:hypothetical protein
MIWSGSPLHVDPSCFPFGPRRVRRRPSLIDMVEEGTPSSPIETPGMLLNVNSISEFMGGLCLHANEARAFEGLQLHGSNHPRPERQHNTILRPRLA